MFNSIRGAGILFSPAGAAPPPVLNPLGAGLNGAFQYSTAFPFVNALNNQRQWTTSNAGTFDTLEEAYVALDSDGYPTSLTASPIPAGGQKYTYLQLLLYNALFTGAPPRTPPNTPTPYYSGGYTFAFQGSFGIKMLATTDVDFSSMSVTQNAGSITLAGNGTGANGLTGATNCQITSTLAAGQTGVITFNVVAPTNGITLQLNAITAGNYFKAAYLGLTANYSAWQGGQLLNPDWITAHVNFKCLRFMDWMQTNNSTPPAVLTAIPGNGATSGTLASVNGVTGGWTLPTGSYYLAFDTGDETIASFTTGSTAVTWSPALSKAGTATTVRYSTKPTSWANRPKTTALLWARDAGPPMEALIEACNRTGADAWINVPPEMLNADITSLLTFFNTNLTGGQLVYVERSNETWNGQFNAGPYDSFRGTALWGSANQPGYSYCGKRTADIADLSQAISTTRYHIIMGAQAANTFVAQQKLTAPAWVANGGTVPWSAHKIDGICIDQYWQGNNYPPAWLALTQAQFVTNFFTEVTTGGAIAGGYPGGQAQAPIDRFNQHKTAMVAFGNMPIYCYEGDPNTNSFSTFLQVVNGGGQGSIAAWVANHGYSYSACVIDSNGNPQQVTSPGPGGGNGTSGGSAPAWNTAVGSTTTDGGITWTRVNNAAVPWVAGKTWLQGDCVKDSNNNLQVVTSNGGTSAGTAPAWATSAGTTADGSVTWTYYAGGDGRQDSMSFAYLAACDSDTRIQAPILAWLRAFYNGGGKLLNYFVGDFGVDQKYGNWAAGESLLQNPTSYKWQALQSYIQHG